MSISLINPLAPTREAPTSMALVAPTPAAEAAWDRIVDELLRLRSLDEDWDGQGACAMQSANVDVALAWVNRMRSWERAMPPSTVAPGVFGEVHLVWQQGSLYLDAEIREPRQVEWLLSYPGQPTRQWKTDLTETWLVGPVD